VDATYRDNLRELNESSFVRVNGRLGEFNATWEGRFIALEAKLEHRMAESDAKWEHRIAELRTELVKELADVKGGLKWIYAFWAPTALAVIGTGAGVIAYCCGAKLALTRPDRLGIVEKPCEGAVVPNDDPRPLQTAAAFLFFLPAIDPRHPRRQIFPHVPLSGTERGPGGEDQRRGGQGTTLYL